MIWQVPQSWQGETCVILAGGPSLWGFDAAQLAGLRIITINDSWRICPRADIHYFCDQKWWQDQVCLNREALDGSVDFLARIHRGFWVAGNQHFTRHPHVKSLRLSGQLGFDPNPECLRHGSNSGYQAIHLAAQLGAKRIILLGYDMQLSGQRTHWHSEHREYQPPRFARALKTEMLPLFDMPDSSGVSLKSALRDRGVEVINATPNSALVCWPQMTLEQALEPESQVEECAEQTRAQTGGGIRVNG